MYFKTLSRSWLVDEFINMGIYTSVPVELFNGTYQQSPLCCRSVNLFFLGELMNSWRMGTTILRSLCFLNFFPDARGITFSYIQELPGEPITRADPQPLAGDSDSLRRRQGLATCTLSSSLSRVARGPQNTLRRKMGHTRDPGPLWKSPPRSWPASASCPV